MAIMPILYFAAAAAAAPVAAPEPSPAPQTAAPPNAATLEITATIHMDSIKFRQSGDSQARVWAEPGGQGEWKLDSPLPKPIPVGKTFTNVDLKLDARAWYTEEGLKLQGSADAQTGRPAPSDPPQP